MTNPITILIRVGVVAAVAEQRLTALGLACVGVLTLTTAAAVLAVALGVCL